MGYWGKDTKPEKPSKGRQSSLLLGVAKEELCRNRGLSLPVLWTHETQKRQFSHGKAFYTTEYGVLLDEVQIWQTPRPVEGLVLNLQFIENKDYWFAYLQGGVRQVSFEDFQVITGAADVSLLDRIRSTKDLESPSDFALETHLEVFIYENWANIDWGMDLELYRIDEQDGRQFPAGRWSIDFLAVDRRDKSLVVIELKKGKTSDATIGQILRYMAWVNENVAEEGQNVRGIIIARSIDEALKYAVKGLPHIAVKTYRVDFRLYPFGK